MYKFTTPLQGHRQYREIKEILREIEEQLELGDEGLLEEGHWMLEVNLGDLENTSGELRRNTGY